MEHVRNLDIFFIKNSEFFSFAKKDFIETR